MSKEEQRRKELEYSDFLTEGMQEFEANKHKHVSQLVTPGEAKALSDWMRLDAEGLDKDPEILAVIARRKEEAAKSLEQRVKERTQHTHIPTEEEALRAYTLKLWFNLNSRCNDKGNRSYQHWGGLGIRLHQPWAESFEAFVRDVGLCPSPQYELRRINPAVSVHFEPGNVMWKQRGTTQRWREQGQAHPGGRPKRGQQALIEYQGELYTMPELSKKTGIKLSTIQARYSAGKSVEQIVNPVRANARGKAWVVEASSVGGGTDGTEPVLISLIDLCRAKGAQYSTVKARLNKGVPLAQALEPKKPKQTHEDRKRKQREAYHAKKASKAKREVL